MGVRVFVKIDPTENERRWYVVSWGPTLFGKWAVVCTWGRLGTDWSQRQVQEFDTQDQAVDEANTQIQRRENRGYTAVTC
ncbi:MAG: WGR domain-containing protein [Chloroflexi bacterium]|nr:WGR domain-containing protein [Chloroflexota bacterium]